MTTTQEFFQEHAQNGALTPEQAAQFLELAQGDTGITPENGDAPDATTDPVSASNAVQAEPDPANTVILTRDGKHTINYEKLVEAREAKQQAEARAEALDAELQALKAQAQSRADAGQAPTQADNVAAAAEAALEQGVDPEIFGDFSEEALANGIKTLMGREVAKLRGELAQLVQPLQAKQATDATDAHMQAIYASHPDADSVAESQELNDWIARQPSFARAGYESVLQKGTTAEIIEFFDTFKAATGKTQAQGAAQADPRAAAKAALARLPATVPASLSDIPGGTAGPASRHEAMSKLSPIDQVQALAEMSQEAREAYLNRRM